MNNPVSRPETVAGLKLIPLAARLAGHSFSIMLDKRNRRVRREKGVNPADALFNFLKLSVLKHGLLKYRHAVRFGEFVVLDSTIPPYPSPAFDKRIANYINTLDMRRPPSGIASVSTTNACPYSCAFCSTDARRATDTDLDEELLKKTIRQIESLGVASIILHGGEPLYRYDRFLRLVKEVDPDTCLWMFTTGYGATLERARELKDNRLFGVWVSLDHYQPEVHNQMTGHPEAFQNACRAVRCFREVGVYTCLSLVPPKEFEKFEEFRRYYDMAKRLGVAEIGVMETKPCGREVCRGVKSYGAALSQWQRELHRNGKFRDHPPLSGLSTWLEQDTAFGCR